MTTDSYELPELPKPDVRCGEYAGPPGEGASENYYTADQMREYALLAVKAERERCIQTFKYWLGNGDSRYEASCLDAIRKGTSPLP